MGRAPRVKTYRVLAAAAACAALAGCGDTLVDHDATDLQALLCDPGTATCDAGGELTCRPDSPTECGATCADCTAGTVPANAIAACLLPAAGGQGRCGFECTGGRLRCGDACCEATQITAGLAHSCALTSAGSLVCWGSDAWGQITDRVTLGRIYPPTVAGQGPVLFGSGVTAAAAGQLHTCAVVDGVVRCVGWNDFGQAPDAVPGLGGVVALAAGQRHTCALTSAGAVTCWGARDQRGGDDGTARFTPIASGVLRISAGLEHTCAVMTSGAVRCWGGNTYGQLGDGTTAGPRLVPVEPIAAGMTYVAAGHSHTCAALPTDGRPPSGNVYEAVRCWGAQPGSLFLLGEPQLAPAIPLKDADTSVIRFAPLGLATGRTHVCVLGDDELAGIFCFGAENGAGQLGTNAAPTSEAAPIPSSAGARAVAAGDDHTCAIWVDGGVRCWGSNAAGQLGDGTDVAPGAGVIVTVSGR